VSGGNDIDPALYGAQAHPKTSDVRPERDHAELALLREDRDDRLFTALVEAARVRRAARGHSGVT